MLVFSYFLIALHAWGKDFHVELVRELNVNKPAFMTLIDQPQRQEIVISSFGLFGRDHLYKIHNAKDLFIKSELGVESFSDRITWPNKVDFLDATVFGERGFLVPSGFLLPTKSTGAITFLCENNKPFVLTTKKSGYFYHRAIFESVTGEGLPDLITARAKTAPWGSDGELVWLKRPKQALGQKWDETVLTKGPDIHFRTFRSRGILFVVAAEFFNHRLTLHRIDRFGNVDSRIIDSTLGNPFDLDFFDINNDGVLDLLVTNHEHDLNASVFAYEVPNDPMDGVWRRHTLTSQIETRQKGISQASPGVAKAFNPVISDKSSKPWILVSGDGSQRVHLLRAKNEDPNNWDYTETVILDVHSTVGEPLVGDFDGDGLADFLIPAYDANKIYVMSLKDRGN